MEPHCTSARMLQLWRMKGRLAVLMIVSVAACAGRVEPAASIVPCDAGARHWAPDARNAVRDLRVWIDVAAQTHDGWTPYGWRRLRVAMSEWNSIKLPIRLVEARSARESDIVVDIIEAIPGQTREHRDQAGVTTLTHESGTILRARVFVAISAPFGVRYSVADQIANLTHELGHALGVPHAEGTRALMSVRRVGAELTAADIALARRHFGCAVRGS